MRIKLASAAVTQGIFDISKAKKSLKSGFVVEAAWNALVTCVFV